VSRWDGWGWYPKPPPKRPPPERGIKVKKIGATWWGQRWIEALERLSAGYSNRLARGRTYARAGRVHDLEVGSGTVTARVTGSRSTPYKVTLRLAPLGAAAWEKAIAAMGAQALFAAELLAGEMPRDIDEAFRAGGRSLFPAKEKDLQTACSCPDWANPCKHVAATHYVLGEAFDRDPFLLFELRGRGKDEVLAALRRLRGGVERASGPARAGRAAAAGGGAGASRAAAAGAGAGASETIATVSFTGRAPEDFERFRGPIAHLRFRIEPPASPAALLRQLGTPPLWSLAETPADVLGPLAAAAAALARTLALGPVEETPSSATAYASAPSAATATRSRRQASRLRRPTAPAGRSSARGTGKAQRTQDV
jgi:uncharacterized Zn finger protein